MRKLDRKLKDIEECKEILIGCILMKLEKKIVNKYRLECVERLGFSSLLTEFRGDLTKVFDCCSDIDLVEYPESDD